MTLREEGTVQSIISSGHRLPLLFGHTPSGQCFYISWLTEVII